MHQYTREATIAGRANVKAREVPVTISTTSPVDRGDIVEVLSHDPDHVDLSRAPLPLIESHDTRQLPIGVVDGLHLDGKRLRGIVRFGESARADEVFKDVLNGVIRGVSVGYSWTKEVARAGRQVTVAWKPHEVSAVAVPADVNAAFFRSQPNSRSLMNTQATDAAAEITALAAQYSKYVGPDDVARAVAERMPVEAFQNLILRKMESGHTSASAPFLDMTRQEASRYSFGRALQALATGDWTRAGFERECSRALEKLTGQTAEGMLLPSMAWARDFNAGTATEAGNLIATDMRGDLFVDALRNSMVLGRLGVRMLPNLTGNVDIPRKSTPSTLAMLSEIGSASETNPQTAKLTLTPRRVSAFVEISKQALIQSGIAVEAMVRDDLLVGAAVLIENQCINGNGTAPNILGIRNYTTIGTTTAGANGASLIWDHLVDLETVCANSNAEPAGLAGYVSNSRVRARAKRTARGTNLDFILPPNATEAADGLVKLNGYRFAVTNNIPNNLTKGTSTTVCSSIVFSSDWSMAVLGLFGAPDVVIDPYTLAATGQVRITLNQFVDFGLRQPAAFAKIDDVLTA